MYNPFQYQGYGVQALPDLKLKIKTKRTTSNIRNKILEFHTKLISLEVIL